MNWAETPLGQRVARNPLLWGGLVVVLLALVLSTVSIVPETRQALVLRAEVVDNGERLMLHPLRDEQAVQSQRYLFPRAVLGHAMEVTAAQPQIDLAWVEEGLKRDEGEELKLSFSMKPPAATASRSTSPPDVGTPGSSTAAPSPASTSTTTTAVSAAPSGGLKLGLKHVAPTNPLKRPNVFKMTASKNGSDKAKEKGAEKSAT